MKPFSKVGLVLVVALALAVSGVLARTSVQGLPTGTSWSTGIQVQNIGGATATIVLTGYDAAGSATYTDSTTGASVAPGASVTYTSFPSGPSSFNGAGVLSSDQPIVAIVNINNAGAGGFAAGQYQGTDSTRTGTTIRFPLVKNNFGSKCTTFFVQNAGSASAVIYAKFSNGSSWNSGAAVGVGDMVTVDPALASPAVPGTSPFALTVTSTQALAGTVAEHFCTNANALQSTRGFSNADGDDKLLAPIYKNAFGSRSNGLQVQNTGGSPANVSVTYSHSPLSSCQPSCASYTQFQNSVPAGASVTFFKNTIVAAAGGGATGSSGTPLPNGSLAAATVTSNGTVVAIVNESYDSLPAGVVRQAQTTYSAVPDNLAAIRLAAPLVKEEFGLKSTGIQIQNADTTNATVRVTYTMNAGAAGCQGTFVVQNISIAAGQSVTLFRQSAASATVPGGGSWSGGNKVKAGCFGGAIIQSTNSKKLVAIINESDINPNASLRQDIKNYEAFAAP
jgi:hypothetical protein